MWPPHVVPSCGPNSRRALTWTPYGLYGPPMDPLRLPMALLCQVDLGPGALCVQEGEVEPLWSPPMALCVQGGEVEALWSSPMDPPMVGQQGDSECTLIHDEMNHDEEMNHDGRYSHTACRDTL
jgi:hypothetical protein